MPRPRNHQPTVETVFMIKEQTRSLLKTALYDPREGKVPFGASSALVEHLITKWLRTKVVREKLREHQL